ncbi:hypothetical protein [Mesorhizobium sp. CN2-181]|uniref:hypothetical protein n=1 Tax=Mesorhizobium yinganensis TaxID=3157707 RepID=UPI0032B87792
MARSYPADEYPMYLALWREIQLDGTTRKFRTLDCPKRPAISTGQWISGLLFQKLDKDDILENPAASAGFALPISLDMLYS